ncbi:MAG: hypothetical protein ACI8RD_004238 [Bacillariaceae sp.]|jgi:hypothetical protein
MLILAMMRKVDIGDSEVGHDSGKDDSGPKK